MITALVVFAVCETLLHWFYYRRYLASRRLYHYESVAHKNDLDWSCREIRMRAELIRQLIDQKIALEKQLKERADELAYAASLFSKTYSERGRCNL